ncbi:substrate-binding domain-containing protein [Coralliovum pocilloporae]|uniref:substrate-binding domain-containing protein n=1 Tax=Coralliovum pocilloporae TaxID=3066369 RepID=UPI0033070415
MHLDQSLATLCRSTFVACTIAALLQMPLLQEAEAGEIIVQSTTSTANSGLYDHLLPIFEARTGIKVRVVAVGTGQAIKNARNGDADVLLVHAKDAEEQFVKDGFGTVRHDLMYNDFVLVGPASDPAALGGLPNPHNALSKIEKTKSVFASRGDNSGTHKKELKLWAAASLDPSAASGTWYRETGSGMGATLNVAIGMNAYTLTDRATWISFGNKADHRILVEGDPALFNQYGIILVSKDRHSHVNEEDGTAFVNWMLSEEGQSAIAAYRRDGKQLFFPNAN